MINIKFTLLKKTTKGTVWKKKVTNFILVKKSTENATYLFIN